MDGTNAPIGLADCEHRAKDAQRRRDWTAALALWNACLQGFPGHPRRFEWRIHVGSALIELGRDDEAASLFAELAETRPGARAVLAALARLAQRRKDWAEAAARWDLCIEKFPNHPSVRSWRTHRVEALERQELWRDAYHAWDELFRDGARDPATLVGRARCLLQWKGPTAEAERFLAAALEAFPDHYGARHLHAQLAAHRGDDRAALGRYLKCLELHPDRISIYAAAMAAAVNIGDSEAAGALIAGAPEEVARSPMFRCRVMLNYHRLCADIAAGLRIIAGIEPEEIDIPCVLQVAQFLDYANRIEEQFNHCRRALERYPHDLAVMARYLNALYSFRGKAAFESEKSHLLAPFSGRQILTILIQIRACWLSVAEAKQVIDHHWAKDWDPALKLRPLLPLIYRSESEVISHLAERLEGVSALKDRLMGRLLIAGVTDRQRIETAGLVRLSWSEFQAVSQAIESEIAAVAASPSDLQDKLAEVLPLLPDLTQRCEAAWIKSAISYWDAASFAAWLADRIRTGEPTSAIRVCDGEGNFLPYPPRYREFQVPDQRSIQQIWWGEERLSGPSADAMTDQFIGCLLRADAIGVPPAHRLLADMEGSKQARWGRAYSAILGFMAELPPEKLRSVRFTSGNFNIDLEQWDLYRQIFVAVSSVSVVSCHDLGRALAERYGVGVRLWFRIPPEFRFGTMFEAQAAAAPELFYPTVFNRIMADVTPLPGELFLVAAGFLGKLLCDRIRERGGIALDIGSTADLWLGHITRRTDGRGINFDVASSLIDGQPFQDTFDPKAISHAEPCRSDRSRRHNLTGRFDALFADEPPPPEPGRYALRIIGHPRCGSTYAAQVMSLLGVDLGHEQLGEDGLCSWIHTVDDRNPPFDAPSAPATAFRVTLAYVRDPAAAIPSIMLENWGDNSWSFRRFHIARLRGVDIARRRDPLARAVESYLQWTAMVEQQRPLATLRVEYFLEDLAANDDRLIAAGLQLDWTRRDAAAATPTTANASATKFLAKKPEIAPARYRDLPADLADGLAAFCERYGYPAPESVSALTV